MIDMMSLVRMLCIGVCIFSVASNVSAQSFSQDHRLDLAVFKGKDCYPTNLIAEDLNKDGWTDLAVTGFCNRFAVFFADPKRPGHFLPPKEVRVPTSAIGMAVLPNQTDGLPFLVVSNCANPDAISQKPLLHVVSMDSFKVINTLPSGGKAPDDIAIGDFNGDGLPDAVVGHWKEGVLSLLLGQKGNGNFKVPTGSSPQLLTIGDEHWQIVARDLNRDRKTDIATIVWTFGQGNTKDSHLVILRGNGQGVLDPNSIKRFPIDREARSLAVADLNDDGHLDVAVANPGSGLKEDGSILILFGDETGDYRTQSLGFLTASSSADTSGRPIGLLAPQGIAVEDLDRDGKPDLIVASRPVNQSGRLTVLYNDGKGSFSMDRAQILALGPKDKVSNLSFQPLITADLNGDGMPDVAVANNNANTVSIFFNTHKE